MSFFSDAEQYLAQQLNSYVSAQRQQATSEVSQTVQQQSADVQAQIQQQGAEANRQIAHTGHVVEMAAWITSGVVIVGVGYWLSKK